jgi:outer membrane protein OmpA-like peptidoglycan-associated protein
VRGAPVLALTAAVVLGASAAPVHAGPDFVADDRAGPLAASDARTLQQPSDEILFALDDAALDQVALLQVAAAVHWLEGRPDDRLIVEGRADSSGTPDHNADLAIRRAEAVRHALIAGGVDPDRIVLAVYGENGARPRPDAHDRRAVVYATTAPLPEAISAELDRAPLEVVWTHRGTRLRETRGITPVATIARRP